MLLSTHCKSLRIRDVVVWLVHLVAACYQLHLLHIFPLIDIVIRDRTITRATNLVVHTVQPSDLMYTRSVFTAHPFFQVEIHIPLRISL